MNKSMSFAADICKNAMVTDCLVLKDKKVFPRQWNARESLFEPRKHSGFQVRDLSLSLSLCLSHAHTQMQYLHLGDCLIIWWSKLLCLRQRKRQRDNQPESVCWGWEWGGVTDRNLFPLFLPGPTLLLQDSCLLCKQVVLTIRGDLMGFHIVRPELVMSRFGCWH